MLGKYICLAGADCEYWVKLTRSWKISITSGWGLDLYPLGNVEPLTHSEEQHILRIIYWTGMLEERMEEAKRPDRRLLQ